MEDREPPAAPPRIKLEKGASSEEGISAEEFEREFVGKISSGHKCLMSIRTKVLEVQTSTPKNETQRAFIQRHLSTAAPQLADICKEMESMIQNKRPSDDTVRTKAAITLLLKKWADEGRKVKVFLQTALTMT